MGCESKVVIGETTKIIGILLIKDEDIFIEKIITNVVEFCDEIIVADNKSTDSTASIIESLQIKYSKIQYYSIDHPSESHVLISTYANKPVWIFAVDGDELYDPTGLSILRKKIMRGEFDDSWVVFGNVLNCIELDLLDGQAKGYLSPPCRSMTKLYNFSIIEDWSGDCPERLHGGQITFKTGAHALQRLDLHEDIPWDDSFFRCLHLCFLRRSSKEKDSGQRIVIRKNISDKNSEGIMRKVLALGLSLFGLQQRSAWKNEKYMRGNLVQKDVSSFIFGDDQFSVHGKEL